ncbi:MAG: nuclear transport factor 2 family protein [Phycisphaerales bacterium]|nr:MAG: nuclear transport factor 2 family protein [Phycisphaerales bacterium]
MRSMQMATRVAKKKTRSAAKPASPRAAAKRTTAVKAPKKTAGKTAKKFAAKAAPRKATGAKGSARPAKKPAAKPAAKKPAKKADPTAPRPVSSGKGPTPTEVGAGVVEMLKAGKPESEIWAKWFSPKLVSIENMPTGGLAWHGIKAVRAKGEAWMQEHAVHGVEVEGPYAGATGFAVRYTMNIEHKPTGNTQSMTEVGVYTVRNGKVVLEEFMYGR